MPYPPYDTGSGCLGFTPCRRFLRTVNERDLLGCSACGLEWYAGDRDPCLDGWLVANHPDAPLEGAIISVCCGHGNPEAAQLCVQPTGEPLAILEQGAEALDLIARWPTAPEPEE